MVMTDPLGDMLTRIRNGQRAGKSSITSPASKLRVNVLDVLKREGYIRNYKSGDTTQGAAELTIELKYHDGAPVIKEIDRISKPGRRVYSKIADLRRVANGLGITILSTPRGVMTDRKARAVGVGGEVICFVA